MAAHAKTPLLHRGRFCVALCIVASLLCITCIGGAAAAPTAVLGGPHGVVWRLAVPPPPQRRGVSAAANPSVQGSSSSFSSSSSSTLMSETASVVSPVLISSSSSSSINSSNSSSESPPPVFPPLTTQAVSPPQVNVTKLLTVVYSPTIMNDSTVGIVKWCARNGGAAAATNELPPLQVTEGAGYWVPVPGNNASAVNITFYRSFLSVTTSATLIDALLIAGNNGTIPGIVSAGLWSKMNMEKQYAWIAGLVVAVAAVVAACGLITVRLLYRRGYVNATGPHLQTTGTYTDLEMARMKYEARISSRSGSLASPPPPPPLPMREQRLSL
ncbi:hypothetical protein NESM_000865000 [Novymonas esmeraldas]|uniref:Membrane-associated protein n=1 Tax=Novymonas esmeraldas TaxID=1808958 RepID=A0AAW0EZF6_9TRYP